MPSVRDNPSPRGGVSHPTNPLHPQAKAPVSPASPASGDGSGDGSALPTHEQGHGLGHDDPTPTPATPARANSSRHGVESQPTVRTPRVDRGASVDAAQQAARGDAVARREHLRTARLPYPAMGEDGGRVQDPDMSPGSRRAVGSVPESLRPAYEALADGRPGDAIAILQVALSRGDNDGSIARAITEIRAQLPEADQAQSAGHVRVDSNARRARLREREREGRVDKLADAMEAIDDTQRGNRDVGAGGRQDREDDGGDVRNGASVREDARRNQVGVNRNGHSRQDGE